VNIFVHVLCRYGGVEAATFCGLCSIYDQLQYDKSVNIYMLAKLYHLKRAGCIGSKVWDTGRYRIIFSLNKLYASASFTYFSGYTCIHIKLIFFYWKRHVFLCLFSGKLPILLWSCGKFKWEMVWKGQTILAWVCAPPFGLKKERQHATKHNSYKLSTRDSSYKLSTWDRRVTHTRTYADVS